MIKYLYFLPFLCLLVSCGSKKTVDEDKLGIIEADVRDVETNLSRRPEYSTSMPGSSERFDRSFENAPPLIPHTTDGFFPITAKNNICISCHMPDKVKESKAIPISPTHFICLRPKLQQKNGKYVMTDSLSMQSMKNELNKAYFNCSQCHVPQSKITVNIENLFTPEFRAKTGLKQSNLKDKIKEGISL